MPVSFNKVMKKWHAYINVKEPHPKPTKKRITITRRKHLGYYDSEREAWHAVQAEAPGPGRYKGKDANAIALRLDEIASKIKDD